MDDRRDGTTGQPVRDVVRRIDLEGIVLHRANGRRQTSMPARWSTSSRFVRKYIKDYVEGNINRKTHPLMRTFKDADCCDPNPEVENAKVASVSCMHHCITAICGGDKQTGKGCRFSFPMKLINHTVPAIMQVSVMFISRL
jgi:hypothetical protein